MQLGHLLGAQLDQLRDVLRIHLACFFSFSVRIITFEVDQCLQVFIQFVRVQRRNCRSDGVGSRQIQFTDGSIQAEQLIAQGFDVQISGANDRLITNSLATFLNTGEVRLVIGNVCHENTLLY
ncbi:hypothetical protein D3C84_919420 [compost metagenome]